MPRCQPAGSRQGFACTRFSSMQRTVAMRHRSSITKECKRSCDKCACHLIMRPRPEAAKWVCCPRKTGTSVLSQRFAAFQRASQGSWQGAAGIVQGTTVPARGVSTTSTGGLANPLIATSETGGSLLAIAFALLTPLVFGVLVVLALVWLLIRLARLLRNRRRGAPAPGA